MSRERGPPSSIAISAPSDAYSSRSRSRHSRCPNKGARRTGGQRMAIERKPTLGRRQFFRGLGAGVAAGALAPGATEALADTESNDEKRKARYRETEEVKTY